MSDQTLAAALRHIGQRPFTPGSWYEGDRPCQPWPLLLRRLFPSGRFAPPALRRSHLYK